MTQRKNPPPGASGEGPSSDLWADQGAGINDRLERYSTARHHARQVLSALDALPRDHPLQLVADLPGLTGRIRECGEYLGFRHYFTVGELRLHKASFCKAHLLCPLCAIRRGAKSLARYLSRYETIRQERPQLTAYLVTFTVRNGPDLPEREAHLRDSWRRLCKRRRDYLDKGRGWTELARADAAVWSYEVTNKGKGWHPHLHAVLLCETEPCQRALRSEWEAITEDSFMVDVRAIDAEDPASGFCEVFKYALKFSGLSIDNQLEAFRCLRGRQLLGSFGRFRGVAEPETLTDEPLDALPFVELFYRFRLGVGYDLKSATVHEAETPAESSP